MVVGNPFPLAPVSRSVQRSGQPVCAELGASLFYRAWYEKGTCELEIVAQPIKECDSFEEMFTAAAVAAGISFGRPVSGVLYSQGGRRFISAVLPVKMALSIVRRDSAPKKGDASQTRNRPLEASHVKDIKNYLETIDRYLLPPIVVNTRRALQVFAQRTESETKPCMFVLPDGEYLYVTDGQHRLEALKDALVAKPSLENDSIGVTVVEENDLDKIHQDFFDAAQVKRLSPSLLVDYDGREPINAITKDVSSGASIFHGRIERIGSVGKYSLMLFTLNQIKEGIKQLVVGDWSMYADALTNQARQAIAAAQALWRTKMLAFLDEFTTANPQWNEVANRPLETGQITNIPSLREHYLHFSGAGLLVLCGVGHAILELECLPDGSLSDIQKDYVGRLATLDWQRRAPLWSDSVVDNQTKISAAKTKVALAVAQAKTNIGLSLTEKESDAVRRASESGLQPEQEPEVLISA